VHESVQIFFRVFIPHRSSVVRGEGYSAVRPCVCMYIKLCVHVPLLCSDVAEDPCCSCALVFYGTVVSHYLTFTTILMTILLEVELTVDMNAVHVAIILLMDNLRIPGFIVA